MRVKAIDCVQKVGQRKVRREVPASERSLPTSPRMFPHSSKEEKKSRNLTVCAAGGLG